MANNRATTSGIWGMSVKIVLAALIACLPAGISCVSAQAQGVPQGSYLQTCSSIRTQGDTLFASCKTVNGDFQNTSLAEASRCTGDIANNNGTLQCSSFAGGQVFVLVQAVAAQGQAGPNNNNNANILVLVTDVRTGEGIASLAQSGFQVIDHFGIPGQICGFSNNITGFNSVGTGAYQIQVATHSAQPPAGGCRWVSGDYLGQVFVKTATIQGQAAFLLAVR